MGVSRWDAARRLKTGDIRFILDGDPAAVGELAKLHPSAPFYSGLLVESAGDAVRARALFEAALESPSPRVRGESAEKLIRPMLEGKDRAAAEHILDVLRRKNPLSAFGGDPAMVTLRGAALYTLDRFDELADLYRAYPVQSSWDRIFSLILSPDAGDLADFFLSETPDSAYIWTLAEIRNRAPQWPEGLVLAAVTGRLAAARLSFNEALEQFKTVLDQDRSLFLRYPSLLSDLGRTFQASYQKGGTEILLQWGEAPAGLSGAVRYRLFYFAGRIQRQLGEYDKAAEYFTRALALAPDGLQADACMWYILQMTLANKPEDTAALLKTYMPRWHSPAYFSDILDQLSRYLTANREWDTLAELFPLIRAGADGASIAKYAYIIGRAVSLGYLGSMSPAMAEGYYRTAFEEGKASFYYRALAASRLGETTPIPEAPGKIPDRGKDFPHPAEMEFFLNFFQFGAGGFAYGYLEKEMRRLTVGELRKLAESLAESRRWAESIRLISHCMEREEYEPDRRDMELYYPRPFRDLIEGRAREEGLPAELFYGLIRTESAFIPNIGSRAGAVGLAQLMPATAMETAGRILRQGGPDYIEGGKINLNNPVTNIHLGASYLSHLMERMDSPLLALLAYNGGMGRVRRWRGARPDLPEDLFLETVEITETREYGKKVLAAAAAYGYLYYGMTMEAVVADIYR
jgi:soluble lytic murein transglycosylase